MLRSGSCLAISPKGGSTMRLQWRASLFLAMAVIMPAQNNTGRYGGHGYAVFGAGAVDGAGLMSVGVGGEGFLVKGLAIGGELSYLFPRNFSQGVGLVSVDPAYHFLARPGHSLAPFVAAGY